MRDAAHSLKGTRDVWQPDSESFAATPVYDGDRLRHGNCIDGPAIVEKVTTTVFVPSAFHLEVDPLGGFLLYDEATGANR